MLMNMVISFLRNVVVRHPDQLAHANDHCVLVKLKKKTHKSCVIRKPAFCNCLNKGADLISTFVFAT